MPLAKSFDHVGPLARRIADVACLFDALTSRHGVSHGMPGEHGESLKGMRIGWPVSFYDALVDESVIGGRQQGLRPAIMRLQRPTNLTGHPSLAVPCGFTAEKLPVALQLIGPRMGEGRLLAIAQQYEAANPWYLQRPPTMELAQVSYA